MADLLASVDDVELRVGRSFDSDERARCAALLEDVSGMVRLYCGQQWTSGSVTVRRRVRHGRVRLSQRDITDVTGVADVLGNSLGFEWDGLDTVFVGGGVTRFDLDSLSDRASVDVTYTVDSPVPAVVRAVVCQMAARSFGRPADSTGVQSETIQGYSYSVGAAAAAGPVGMLADERRALDGFRRVVGVAWMGP